MARPLNKTQLLASAQKEFGKLENLVSSLTFEQMAAVPAPGMWAIKDILSHLVEWHQMFFGWYEAGLRGETPAVPAEGYKWSQLPALNQYIYEKYCQLSSDQALAQLHESHKKTIQFIESLSDGDLSSPGLYKWMNQNTLMAYLNSVTAAHYVWAVKDVKKILQNP